MIPTSPATLASAPKFETKTKAATCSEEGYKAIACKVCGKEKKP